MLTPINIQKVYLGILNRTDDVKSAQYHNRSFVDMADLPKMCCIGLKNMEKPYLTFPYSNCNAYDLVKQIINWEEA